MMRVFVEIARTVGKLLSFLARIDKNRRIPLHEGFALAEMLVLVCGFAVRIVCSISRSRLRDEVVFGLAWLKH
jgi:hypothetical protein